MSNRYGDDHSEEEEEEEDTSGLPQAVLELAQASTPANLKALRACKRCGIIKTIEQFLNDGCENCPFLELSDNPERTNLCTTVFFDGTCAIMDPRESWAAKWLRCDAYLPGVYAITVTGQLDREIEEDLEAKGLRWRCRPIEDKIAAGGVSSSNPMTKGKS